MSSTDTSTRSTGAHRNAWLIGCISLIALLALAGQLLPVTRANFQAEDLQSEFWWRTFGEEYDRAVVENAAWVQDPESLALRVAGYPNPDNTNPEKINHILQTPSEVIIVVTSGRLMDDSVSKKEFWIELARQGNIWVVKWAGYRQQCSRGAFWGWIAGPCN